MECEKAGCEVAFLRADDLNISNCTGCIACTIQIMMGKGRGYCVRHDDFDILDECVMQSDAVILACPTYETSDGWMGRRVYQTERISGCF